MQEELMIIKNNLASIEAEVREKDELIHRTQEEADRYRLILLRLLKTKVGQKIYWVNKYWRKCEENVITEISENFQDSNFFGKEYDGKMCIQIRVKGGGYYIADEIGKTLFFDKEEAERHTRKL